MKKKLPLKFPKPKAVAQQDDHHWHNGGEVEIGFYARSVHKAARKLIASIDLQPNPKNAWDACPVVLLCREAIELHLKSLVDEGSNFLKESIDPLSLAKTHSLRWLAQIVCQIIKAVKLEDEFKCEGVASLAEFSALISELEALDPVGVLMSPASRRPDSWVPDQLLPANVIGLAKRLDGLMSLLHATADELAVMWDQASGKNEFQAGDKFKPTIQ